jgi:hypothetical protein
VNAYFVSWRGGKPAVAIDETAAKARYQMYLTIVDLFGRENASFKDIKSRLIEKDVPEEQTNAPIDIQYTRFAAKVERTT